MLNTRKHLTFPSFLYNKQSSTNRQLTHLQLSPNCKQKYLIKGINVTSEIINSFSFTGVFIIAKNIPL